MTLPITIVYLNVMLTWFHMQINDLWVWHTHVYVHMCQGKVVIEPAMNYIYYMFHIAWYICDPLWKN